MSGWVKLYRSFTDWEWASHAPTVSVFMHLLARANHTPSKWRGKEIGVGEILTGREQLATITGLSVQSVRTALANLKSTGEITIKTCPKYSIISITNWIKYQDNNQQINQHSHQQINQQLTTSKNEKNLRIEEKNIIKKVRTKKTEEKLPPDWKLPHSDGEWAEGLGYTPVQIIAMATDMHDWALSKDVAKADWHATWRRWVRRNLEQKKNGLRTQ